MTGQQNIRRRIRSVGTTRQITKAMQLVAASQLRRTVVAAAGPQSYLTALTSLLGRAQSEVLDLHSPLYARRPITRALSIVVAGDRGLAGAYNSNILKALGKHTRELAVPHSTICIGRRAAQSGAHFSNIEQLAVYDLDLNDADITLAQPVLAEAIELFESGVVDTVHLIYTQYHSTIRQIATTEQLLPVARLAPPGDKRLASTFEPGTEAVVDFATRRFLEATILQALLQARASEQAARMIAMMNATNNADDLIDDLTLAYNEARQGAITQELAEISAGAEALNG